MPYRTYKNAVIVFRRIFAAALLCVLLTGAAAAQTLKEEVEKGIKEKQFAVYIQPVYNLDGRALSNGEVLVRWFHPEKGLIMPDSFIPELENYPRTMRELDLYMLENVCSFLAKQQSENKKVVPLAVNFSRRTLEQEDICQAVKSVAQKYGIASDLLIVEIMEGPSVQNENQLALHLEQLDEDGFMIALDDYGRGFSNMYFLKKLPVDILKLDRKYSFSLSETTTQKEIMALAKMGDKNNFILLAEGIEDEKSAQNFQALGCQKGQGYYFSKPMPSQNFAALLEEK